MTEQPHSYRVTLPLVAKCASCSKAQAVLGEGVCAECGEPLPADQVKMVRAAVKARRAAFKSALERLGTRVEAQSEKLASFETRGVPLSDRDHLVQVIQPAFDWTGDRNPKVKQVLEGSLWDPSEPETRASFTSLLRELDSNLARIESLRSTMPPALWRGVHRALVRSAMNFVRAQSRMASIIIAADYNQAVKLREQFDRYTAEATRHAEQVGRQFQLIRQSFGDGPFRSDGSIDFATAAWTGVGAAVTSVKQAAQLVRTAFAGVPGVATLPEQYVLALLPTLSMGARTADHELLVARARALRDVLDAADASGGWIADSELLISRFSTGTARISEETERLAQQWKAGLPRRHVVRSVVEAYRELVEGALRDLGGIVLTASRASRGEPDGQYTPEVVDGIQSGEVVEEFIRLGAPCANNIDMLYRNASAHASLTITDNGITFEQRRIENRRTVNLRTETLTDDQFVEQYLLLHEMLLALQLTLYPWLASHPDAGVQAAFAATPSSPHVVESTLSLLGGLAGLVSVEVSIDDDRILITGTPRGHMTDQAMINALSLVPAAFSAEPARSTVVLALDGLRRVEFKRTEFVLDDQILNAEGRAQSGLASARWLLESTGELSDYAQATWVTLALTELHYRCAELAPSDRLHAVSLAKDALTRLDEVLPESVRSSLTQAAIGYLTVLATYLEDPAAPSALRQRAADSVAEAHRIGELARSVRDSGGTPAISE